MLRFLSNLILIFLILNFDFFKNGIKTAKKRIVLASLYFGTTGEQQENQLILALQESCRQNPNLQLDLLVDGFRGSRPMPKGYKNTTTTTSDHDGSSLSVLQDALVQAFPKQVTLTAFKSPLVSPLQRKLLPSPWNETVSLQHMKIYLFDNNVILSGANLSDTYFTNRADRYLLIREEPHLTNYFQELVKSIHKLPLDDTLFLQFLQKYNPKNHCGQSDGADTYILPTIQIPFLKVHQDSVFCQNIFYLVLQNRRPSRTFLTLCTAYFNLAQKYEKLLFQLISNNVPVNLIVASKKSNGFFGAKGMKKYIPDIYDSLLVDFKERLQLAPNMEKIQLDSTISDTLKSSKNSLNIWQFERPDWTFHGKGIWLFDGLTDLPYLTTVGSSNYGVRSISRDLEAQVTLITANPQVQQKMKQEYISQFQPFLQPCIGQSGHTGPWIRFFARFLKTYL